MNMEGGNTCDNIGYIIAPMGLSEKQILIYQKLYEKCNFQDMTVKYTIDQLACDIKIANIPVKTIYKNIQIMIKKGYLEVVKKASKGNAPTYKIIKISELKGEPKVNQGRTKGEPKPSNSKVLNGKSENQGRTKGEPKFHPIKEKEKENNIYSDSIQKIIRLYPGKKIKSVRDKKLPSIIKTYGAEQVMRCVERYSKECIGKDKQYILQEGTFWNGRYLDYLDDAQNEQNEETRPKEPFKPRIIYYND